MTDLDDALELVKMEALAFARHTLQVEELRQAADATARALATAETRQAQAEQRLEAAIRMATAVVGRERG